MRHQEARIELPCADNRSQVLLAVAVRIGLQAASRLLGQWSRRGVIFAGESCADLVTRLALGQALSQLLEESFQTRRAGYHQGTRSWLNLESVPSTSRHPDQ